MKTLSSINTVTVNSFPLSAQALAAISFLLLASLLLATPARADRIDGYWCSKDGERLSIDGPAIVTPGGTSMTGNYDRHGFSYKVPIPEKGAGSKIEMSQLNEETMLLRRQTPGENNFSAPETWHRCRVTS